MGKEISQRHLVGRKTQRIPRRVGAAEPLRRDVVDGQHEHASGVAGASAGGVGMGSVASLLWIYGMEAARRFGGAAQYGVPSVLALWRQAMLL